MEPQFAPGGTQVHRDGGRPALVAHRLRLVALEGADAGRSWEVTRPSLVAGTAAGCDVVLADPTVSRQHCEITAREGEYWLRDLGSTNGTFANEVRVVEALVAPGSRIRLGETVLLFEARKKWVRLEESKTASFGALVGESAAMRAVFGVLERIATTCLSCVLLGETGTGKELAARGMHAASQRASGPFVVVDCGAISATLVESELFGHERGAFTGADRARSGAFELADGGTLFLDEIGELPSALQPKLLRCIERREIKRLGADHPTDVDVRLVCATHRPLRGMVETGAFREDLYFRIAEVEVEIPPLRERAAEIPVLAELILADEARQGVPARRLTPAALERLQGGAWPGNVRELRNVLRRAIALAGSEVLDVAQLGIDRPRSGRDGRSHVDSEPAWPPEALAGMPLREAREQWNASLERWYLARVLERCGGDEHRAAEVAGVHPKSLQRLLRQHGLRGR